MQRAQMWRTVISLTSAPTKFEWRWSNLNWYSDWSYKLQHVFATWYQFLSISPTNEKLRRTNVMIETLIRYKRKIKSKKIDEAQISRSRNIRKKKLQNIFSPVERFVIPTSSSEKAVSRTVEIQWTLPYKTWFFSLDLSLEHLYIHRSAVPEHAKMLWTHHPLAQRIYS